MFRVPLVNAAAAFCDTKGLTSVSHSLHQLLTALEGTPVMTLSELLRGQGGVKTEDAIDLGCKGVAGYQSQLKLLAEDCRAWRRQGWCVARPRPGHGMWSN